MKYLSNWQPLVNEDRHTALLFGFLRHAPVANALNPWLSDVLERPVEAKPLSQSAFWPTLPSVVPGSQTTQPELVFHADDGEPVTVLVEVKPGYGMHQREQIAREAVDVAHNFGASRVACVMVGADLAPPMDLDAWRTEVEQALITHLPGISVALEVRYASFASLGRAVQDCARRTPEWAMYAEDVLAHLHRKGVLGYDGAPMLDDLDGLTIRNAVEGFNRAILAARDFFIELHAQPRFEELGLRPWSNVHKMNRDGGSESPTQPVEWFQTTLAMCLYARPNWARTRVVFACFDFLGHDGVDADLCVGVGDASSFTYGFRRADPHAALTHPVLEALSIAELPQTRVGADGQWRYGCQPWIPGQGEDDIDWALSRLQLAATIWDGDLAGVRGLTHPDFEGVSSDRLRHWLAWWSDPARSAEGRAEAGKAPADEIAKLQAELEARIPADFTTDN